MPFALIVALVGSLAIHGVALFGTDVELFGSGPEQTPPPLRAELRPPPPPPATHQDAAKPPARSTQSAAKPAPTPLAAPVGEAAPTADVTPAGPPEIVPEPASTAAIAASTPATPILPASGTIRFVIVKVSLGWQIGRAEHRWEFFEDGRYRLTGVTETSGLAAVLKPMRQELESRGRLVAGGLQPETFRTRKNGQETNENADFDWSAAEVHLARDHSVRQIVAGTQDILSLNYQLAYLGHLAEGAHIGVVTGKKYERYALDALGEEDIDTPAGRFRTLHLRAVTDNVTEIWIALDRQRLPVKIRFTDKKGDSFEQVATELD